MEDSCEKLEHRIQGLKREIQLFHKSPRIKRHDRMPFCLRQAQTKLKTVESGEGFPSAADFLQQR